MTRPLKIHESAPESLKEISDAELDYCAHLILNEFASSSTGAGTLSVNPTSTTGLTSVGTFIDTYRNFPEGNTDTSSSSDTYTFYQNLSTVSANPTRPLMLDGENRLKESTDDNLYSHIINRCLQQLTSGGLGSYRLQSSSPGGTWTQVATINNTLQTGVASTTYLWRNTSASAPSAVRPLKARLLGNEYNVIEMTDNDIITMVNTLRNRISSSGIGQYRLQETAPVGGTWVQVGTIFSDTIQGISGSTFSNTFTNTFTATAFYSRDFNLSYTDDIGGGDYTPNYSIQFTTDGITYDRDIIVDYPGETVVGYPDTIFYGGFGGPGSSETIFYSNTYQGFYSNTFTGEYIENITYSPTYSIDVAVDGTSYDRNYIQDYPGTVVSNYTQIVSNTTLWIRSA